MVDFCSKNVFLALVSALKKSDSFELRFAQILNELLSIVLECTVQAKK
jgi:hypothetical protein